MNLTDPDLILSHRFGVFFYEQGTKPNMVDTRFQKVSGMRAEMKLDTVTEGGENLFSHRLPTRGEYGNLVLERGIVTRSSLATTFNEAFSMFKFSPADILVTAYNDARKPAASWLFHKAIPVKWSLSDLDANANSVLIESMELSYTWFKSIEL
jgi:phage tail-like protein